MRGRRTVLELAPFPRASHEPGIRGRVHRCRPDCVSKAGALRRSSRRAPARLTVNAVRVSFVYARFAYGRNRLLRVASALASRGARVSRCADRQRKATELFGGKSEQNFHKIFTLRQTIVIELPFYIPLLSVRIRVVLYVYLVRRANRNTPIYFTHSNQVSV